MNQLFKLNTMKKPNLFQRIIMPSIWKDPNVEEPLTGEYMIVYSLGDGLLPVTGGGYYDRKTKSWYHDIDDYFENVTPIEDEVFLYAEYPNTPNGFDISEMTVNEDYKAMEALVKKALNRYPNFCRETEVSQSNENNMIVKFKKLHENAVLPKYAKHGDAGLDLYPVSTEAIGARFHCNFGLSVEIPEGYVGLMFPRSSIYKTSYFMSNSVGVIDSGYRGEIKAIFKNQPNMPHNFYKEGHPVAQLIIMPYPTITPEWADELSDTERGAGGFGHTSNMQSDEQA